MRSALTVMALGICLACRADHEPSPVPVADLAPRSAPLESHADPVDELFVRGGCGPTVMGAPFRGARMLCLAATSLALASIALDDPPRAPTISAQLARLIEWGLAPAATASFAGTGTRHLAGHTLPASVLYRGLLGVMLVAHRRLVPQDTAWTPLSDALASSLAADLAGGFIPSYPDGIWPCDHAPAAAFLRLRGNKLAADALVARLRRSLGDGVSTHFPTRVDRRGRVIDPTERSTTLAFTASFLLAAEPLLARSFAERLVARCDRLPLAACREWQDTGHRADAASGPLVAGYSVGATALALVATRALPDLGWNAALLATASLLGGARPDPQTYSLESALLRWGTVARAW